MLFAYYVSLQFPCFGVFLDCLIFSRSQIPNSHFLSCTPHSHVVNFSLLPDRFANYVSLHISCCSLLWASDYFIAADHSMRFFFYALIVAARVVTLHPKLSEIGINEFYSANRQQLNTTCACFTLVKMPGTADV